MKIKIFFLLILISSASCSKRNLAYFSDLERQAVQTEKINNSRDPIIQPDDLLSISVTSLSPEANILFNKGEVIPVGNTASYSTNNNPSPVYKDGYLVDKEGYIDFPVLGKMKIGGMTKAEAKAAINSRLEQYLKEPMVSIRFLNFKITVVGEVNRPSTFTIPTEKINILEAISMAGDMTPFGKRENVLLIREEEGVRTMATLNLNSREILNSPYFYLQQNDLIYIEPDKAREAQTSLSRSNISIGLSIASILSIIISRFL